MASMILAPLNPCISFEFGNKVTVKTNKNIFSATTTITVTILGLIIIFESGVGRCPILESYIGS